MISFVLESVTS